MGVETKKYPTATAFVDTSDVDFLRALGGGWLATTVGKGYVYVTRRRNGHIEYLHRILLGVGDTRTLVDHKDRNTFNNRRSNLRAATKSQNAQNLLHSVAGKSSRFKGVHWHKGAKKWAARIKHGGHSKYLGLFEDETMAAHAYDSAAISHFGEFALVNFPVTFSVQPTTNHGHTYRIGNRCAD